MSAIVGKAIQSEAKGHHYEKGECPDYGGKDPDHTHQYTDGKCVCGAVDPDHQHNYVDNICTVCGDIHTHNYIETSVLNVEK